MMATLDLPEDKFDAAIVINRLMKAKQVDSEQFVFDFLLNGDLIE